MRVAQGAAEPVDLGLRCPECDYNLTGATGECCSWCGWTIDADALAASVSGSGTRRLGAIAAAVVCGLGTLAVTGSLAARGGRFSTFDYLAILAAASAAVGHFCLAIAAGVRFREAWPMRRGDLSACVRFLAFAAIVIAVVGATPALQFAPATLVVNGTRVNGPLEFALTSSFYSLPGWLLLILSSVSFRRRAAVKQAPAALALGGSNLLAPFVVEVMGYFAAEEVRGTSCRSPRPTDAEQDAMIQQAWAIEIELAAAENRQLYDGELARLARCEVGGSTLTLRLDRTWYREFLATHLNPVPSVVHRGMAYLSHALGVSVVVVTRDGFLVFGRRSDRVTSFPGYLHAFGGMVEASDRTSTGEWDVVGSITRELREELQLDEDSIVDVHALGLVRDRRMQQPELLFEARVRMGKDELRRHFDPGFSDGEHTAIECVRDEPEAVIPFLANAPLFAPVAQAALLLHGRQAWGATWYEHACWLTYGELPPLVRTELPIDEEGTDAAA